MTINCGGVRRTAPTQQQTISSANFIQHASYNPYTLRNDISVIKTNSFAFTDTVKAINLPKKASSYSTYAGVVGVVCGWGKTSDKVNTVAENLQFTDLTVITNTLCSQTYGTLTVAASTLCAATPNGRSTCSGDSGGPYAIRENGYYTQIGVTSFVSSAGCESGYPAGFVRVTSFLDWIETNTGLKL